MLDIYSTKVFLYLPDGSLRTQITTALGLCRIEAEQSPSRISTFEALRKEAPLAKGLSFYPQEFFSFVQRTGVPYCIVMNFLSDLSLAKETDPDRMLLLKNIMLSFITLSLKGHYAQVRAHIMLVVGRAEAALADEYEKEPSLFLKGLVTGNEQIDARIEMLRKDKAAFARLFLIRFQKGEDLIKSPELMVKGFITQIQTRYTLEQKLKSYAAPAISTQNEAPARVVYRCGSAVYIDGEEDSSGEYAAIGEGQFHILGSLTTRNLRDVTDRVKNAVTGGICGKKFHQDDEIVVTLLADCMIDATAATGLAQLFVSGLARYKKKKIIVSSVNDGILRKSQGYGMIKEFIRIDMY